ncbi:MAG: type III secretion system export apparatus subunit SctU [Chlamydiota bacterium]
MAEKTEKATPKKLRDARKKGQVAKSQDLPSAFTFIASIWMTLGFIGIIYARISGFLIHLFDNIPREEDLVLFLPVFYYEAFIVIFLCAIPIMVLVSLLGIAINFLAIGPVFSTEVFKPDIKKFNVIQNLKSKFKIKTLFELVKSIFKITVAAYLIYGVMYSALPVLIQTVHEDIWVAMQVYYTFLLQVIMRVGVFFIFVAVLDFVFQKRNFANEMKMEKFEVKQEYKNTEGDPQIKSKRRQTAQEIAYSDGPAGGIKYAKALITNPTHLAIAIGYEREVDPAPYILGMGDGVNAERMIQLAENYDVPIVRNIKLAHKLWEEAELLEFIPEDSYEAVAEILRWIASLNTEQEFDYSESEV